ncbi:hypothetical protein RJT34_24758 [Clitoria ternatea]|uniref:AB hydrolase-1 domain-containing protein n=1 Tax=Clitoria ternatea TaxID=43366 RepID=A0AAN9ILB1_CLITE
MDHYCLPNDSASSSNVYWLLFKVLALIPIRHYLLAMAFILFSFLYNFLELHFLRDLFSGFSGFSVSLTYNSSSQIYDDVVSKCNILHGRYFPTPWLCSPHLQTLFLNYFGRPPLFNYTRQLFRTSDGGTIAWDWLTNSDGSGAAHDVDGVAVEDESIPIVVVIPGLTSDSSSAYIKHLAYHTAKRGWRVVVYFSYNAGWTEDARAVVNYLHKEKSGAPLFIVGTSIGANILVKYLGEDGENIPVAGAVAVCSPWDLLLGDRYMHRRRVQQLYNKALAFGLQDYGKLHKSHFSRNANWEGIEKSLSVRDFDDHATRIVGKYESVDTYYRRCSSSLYVQSVAVPLLCISALDDPICTTEAIPWDECSFSVNFTVLLIFDRANKNIVLATVNHGGHLAFYEEMSACSLWWVRAANEFLDVLHARHMHVQKKTSKLSKPLDSSIDHSPYVIVEENGNMAALNHEADHDRVLTEKCY